MAELLHVTCPQCDGVNRLPAERLRERPNCGRCKQSLFNGHPVPLSEKNFETHVGRSDIPVVVDFWAEPSYAQLLQAEQKRVHDYVVADKGTAQEALDGLVKDWKAIFKEEGKKF